MNKTDLVAAVAERAGLSRTDAAKAVDSMIEAITEALRGGREVRLVGFGSFAVTHRAASAGRDPRSGAAIEIPASKLPKFRAGQALKDALNPVRSE